MIHPGHSRFLVHPHIGYFFHDQVSGLIVTSAIKVFALSLVGIFLPVYLYRLSGQLLLFSLDPLVNGLLWITLYFLIESLVVTFGTLIGIKLIFDRFNLKAVMVMSMLLLVLAVICWYLGEISPLFLLVAAVFNGLHIVYYWIPYHIFFDEKGHDQIGHYGKKLGVRIGVDLIARIVGPLIGGVIIAFFGFPILFGVIIILFLLVTGAIQFLIKERVQKSFSINRVLKDMLFNPKYFKTTLAFAGVSLEAFIYNSFWPIVLMFVLASFVQIGFLGSLSTLMAATVAYFIGVIVDRIGSRRVHLVGVIFNTIFYLPRVFLNSPVGIYVLDIFDRINGVAYALPFDAESYVKGRKDGRDFFAYRELALHGPRVVLLAIIFIIFPLLPDWRLVFLVGMIGSVVSLYMTRTVKS